MAYEPIQAVQLLSGLGFPAMTRCPEKASQTFKQGVPLVLSGGYLQEAAFGAAEIIYGVSSEAGHNQASDGVAAELSEGTPPNQASAVITPIGAWLRDGKVGIYKADGSTVFSVKLKAGQTFSQALVAAGTYYGLVKDGTSNFWYLDSTDTSGDNAVAQLIGVDPSDSTRVFFQFKAALRYFA